MIVIARPARAAAIQYFIMSLIYDERYYYDNDPVGHIGGGSPNGTFIVKVGKKLAFFILSTNIMNNMALILIRGDDHNKENYKADTVIRRLLSKIEPGYRIS